MKTTLKAAFLVICYIVSLSAESSAQYVYTASDLVHYNWDGHNEMLGVASAIIEYNVSLYYCTNSGAVLERYEDDGEQTDARYGKLRRVMWRAEVRAYRRGR